MNSHYVDVNTKPVLDSDLIVSTLYPIFTQDKVSYQCNKPTTITLDDQPYYCNTNTLQFVPFPTVIKLNDTFPIPTFDTHAYITQNLHPHLPSFQTSNDFTYSNHSTTWTDTVAAFFEQAQTLHWSLFSVSILVCLLLIILFCVISYFK